MSGRATVKATYTPAEVAKLLGRPKSTVHDWVKSGALTTTEIAGQKLVPLAALRTNALVWESIIAAAKLTRAAA